MLPMTALRWRIGTARSSVLVTCMCVCAPAERSKACVGGKSTCLLLLLLLLLTECHGHCGMRILMLHPDGFKLNACLSVVACIGGHCCGPNLIAAAGPSALGCTGMCASACATVDLWVVSVAVCRIGGNALCMHRRRLSATSASALERCCTLLFCFQQRHSWELCDRPQQHTELWRDICRTHQTGWVGAAPLCWLCKPADLLRLLAAS